jgi:hypothetical protein
MKHKKSEELRSYRWFGTSDMRAFGHRSRTLQMGYDYEDFAGKPISASSIPGAISIRATRICARAPRR